MKRYSPFAYFNQSAQDIIDLFPSADIKPDQADIVIQWLLGGYGQPKYIRGVDEESICTALEIANSPDFFLTSDGKYAVRFQRGNAKLLYRGSDQHGYYIDIYRCVDDDEKQAVPEASKDKELATRILNFVFPYIPDHIREEALSILRQG